VNGLNVMGILGCLEAVVVREWREDRGVKL